MPVNAIPTLVFTMSNSSSLHPQIILDFSFINFQFVIYNVNNNSSASLRASITAIANTNCSAVYQPHSVAIKCWRVLTEIKMIRGALSPFDYYFTYFEIIIVFHFFNLFMEFHI